MSPYLKVSAAFVAAAGFLVELPSVDNLCADLRARKAEKTEIETYGEAKAAGVARVTVATGKLYCALFDAARREFSSDFGAKKQTPPQPSQN